MTGRRICIYGNSIILGALGLSLQRCPQFDLTILKAPLPGVRELESLKPDVVLFDLEAGHPEAAFSLLKCCPSVLLIGISPDKNETQMWAGRQLKELSTQGLLEVINEQLEKPAIL